MIPAVASVLVPVLVAAVDAGSATWAVRDDPTWETRWRSLDAAESTWLAVIATSRNWMATLTDPEEIRLAKGRRSQESRRRMKVDLAAVPVFVLVAALALAGVLGVGAVVSVLLAFGFFRNAWTYRRERQIKRALETQRQLAGATA
jgi:Flp pilus assembly protein TadB